MNAYEELVNEINETVENKTTNQTWYCCQECTETYQSSKPLTTCIKCNANVYQWPGETKEKAIERALRAKGATFAKAQKQEVDNGNTDKPDAPATSNAKQGGEESMCDTESEKKSKPKRTIKVKKEKAVEQPKPTPEPVQTAVDNEPEAESDEVNDREVAVNAFIEKFALNEIQPVPVGTAIVQTIGFTKWVDKKPNFVLMPPTMTGLEFQQVLDAARAEQPFTSIDCALCSHVDNPDLLACLYHGDMVASLNAGQGTTMVKPGFKVKIGALKTSRGKLRFVVMEVIK